MQENSKIRMGGGYRLSYWLIFYSFIAIYAVFIASFANFSIIDDHNLVSTLLVNSYIPLSHHIIPQIGRFFPLDGQDLNILAFLFSPSPSVFYTFNAACMVLVVLCLVYALEVFLKHTLDSSTQAKNLPQNLHKIIYFGILILLLSPSFITAWLRLFVPERMEFVFLALFLACYAYVLSHNKGKVCTFMLMFGVVFANIALYYKETAFAMILTFGFVHLILGFKNLAFRVRIFDVALILSALVWVVVYVIVILLQKESSGFYGDSPYNQMIVIAKVLLNYILNEPFLFIGIPLLLGFRIYKVFVRKEKILPLLDSSLVACFTLLAEYVVLKINDIHYPLPAYIFGIVGIIACVILYFKSVYIKLVGGICVLIFILNSLPFFVYQGAFYKFVPNNFQASLQFLSTYTKQNPNTRIFLEGVNRASGVEVYGSFGKWLNYYKALDFDLCSDLEIDNVFLGKEEPNSPYSVFRSNAIIPKQSGDVLILMPYTTYEITSESLRTFEEKYKLLYKSEFGYNIPKLGIKSLLKAIALHKLENRGEMILSQNTFGLPLGFYIYKVR